MDGKLENNGTGIDGDRLRRMTWTVMILFFVVFNFGCIGVSSHIMYWMKGNRVDPEFSGLEGKRVAVVVVSNAAPYGPDVATKLLTKKVRSRLSSEVKKIDLVSRGDLENWIDNHDWDQLDYLEIGKGVNADVVLAIELDGYMIQNRSSMFRGNTNFSIQVYDLNKTEGSAAAPVYGKGPIEYAYPRDNPLPSMSLSQNVFEKQFIDELGEQISNYFCGYEAPDRIAREAGRIQ